jgi:hypothetical protein
MTDLLAVVAAYLVGSIPFAQLLSTRRGVDLRRVGSGNVGATNVLRTLGVRPAVLAMMLDAVKGTVAVLVAQRLTNGVAAPVAAGLASMIGHVYPVWLRFRGGKVWRDRRRWVRRVLVPRRHRGAVIWLPDSSVGYAPRSRWADVDCERRRRASVSVPLSPRS